MFHLAVNGALLFRYKMVTNSKYMPAKNKLLIAATIGIVMAEADGLGWWLLQYQTYPALIIQAASDVFANGHPVFAQFTYVQHIVLPARHEVVALRLPLGKLPTSDERINLVAKQNAWPIARWDAQPVPPGLHEVDFELPRPLALSGPLDIELSAPATSHAAKNRAVRIFIESADENYPEGNYRVLAKQKRGDIGMTVIARRRRWESLREQWYARPWDESAQALVALAGLILVGVLPWTLWTRTLM